ncbi:MAG: DsbA family protein [Candidatus Magasanikiibacteriota bacterium]
MIKTKQLLLIFIPALLIVIFVFFIRVLEYTSKDDMIIEAPDKNVKKELQIPIFEDDIIVGNKKAPIQIIAFEDFGCSSCKQQTAVLNKLMEKYPDKIKYIWKGLAITRFPYSTGLSHKYSYCANEQNKFSEFQELAFNNSEELTKATLDAITNVINLNQEKLFDCLSSDRPELNLANNTALATYLTIQGVPAIFINNKQISPPQIIEEWESVLNLNTSQ